MLNLVFRKPSNLPEKSKFKFIKLVEILQFLTRNSAVVFNYSELFSLALNNSADRPMILKVGFDATGYSLHVGHLVPLIKIKEFMYYFHCKVYIILGDYTTIAHDPGRSFRTTASLKHDIEGKILSLQQQFNKLFAGCDGVTIVRNSSWLTGVKLYELIEYGKILNIRDLLDKFKSTNIPLSSAIYPILQGIDSIHLNADIEFGAVDQLTNILIARSMTKMFNRRKQVAFLMPLIAGKDSGKMSKSLGNGILLSDAPETAFKFLLALPDELFVDYCRSFGIDIGNVSTTVQLNERRKQVSAYIVREFWGVDIGSKPVERILSIDLPAGILTVCSAAMKGTSKLQLKRLIRSRCVRIDGVVVLSEKHVVLKPCSLQVGKQMFTIKS